MAAHLAPPVDEFPVEPDLDEPVRAPERRRAALLRERPLYMASQAAGAIAIAIMVVNGLGAALFRSWGFARAVPELGFAIVPGSVVEKMLQVGATLDSTTALVLEGSLVFALGTEFRSAPEGPVSRQFHP
jgi:hypothetical protein